MRVVYEVRDAGARGGIVGEIIERGGTYYAIIESTEVQHARASLADAVAVYFADEGEPELAFTHPAPDEAEPEEDGEE
jgi:hypothetical protein